MRCHLYSCVQEISLYNVVSRPDVMDGLACETMYNVAHKVHINL